jgi:oligopeptide/dipeptide ABC transporter ATP-binding protein
VTADPATNPLLDIDGVRIDFGPPDAPLAAVKNATLQVGAGEIVGIVGESGSGKSLTCRSVMRLIASPGRVSEGSIRFDGRDVLAMSPDELRQYRARDVGMIFQDPFSSLNPVHRVGQQVAETLQLNRGLDRAAARTQAVALLDSVGIPDPERRARAYPHELSGGMRQRVMIALATSSQPRLLIADEPTTALDVTTQRQILELLAKLRADNGMSILLVSHDFGVIAQLCDRVVVMYGGHVVERGPIEAIYDDPQHPYTRALLDSVPSIEPAAKGERRRSIAGQPPELAEQLPGCVFAPRCGYVESSCTERPMTLATVGHQHDCACGVLPFASGATNVSTLKATS